MLTTIRLDATRVLPSKKNKTEKISRNGTEPELSGACAFYDNELNTTLSAYYIIFKGALKLLHTASFVYFDVLRRYENCENHSGSGYKKRKLRECGNGRREPKATKKVYVLCSRENMD